MHGIPDTKQRMRATMKRAIETRPAHDRESRSARIHDQTIALPEWTDAEIVLLYHAMPDEVDTHELILRALRSGKRVYLPRIATGMMGFGRLMDESGLDRLSRHRYGMLEPDASASPWDASEAPQTIVVCPGRAFDLCGNRLGRGGGFYDRFLRELRSGRTAGVSAPRLVIGVCFDIQVVEAVPAAAGDEPMDAIVTDRRVARV